MHSSTPPPTLVLATSTSPTITLDSPLASPSSAPSSPPLAHSSHSSSPPLISPRPSRVFASRPSPVVPSPASPSISRPTSPRQHARHDATKDEPASPTRDGADGAHHPSGAQSHSLSKSNSNMDLSHIFERDVEFASTHHLTSAEAVDVAIPPVLDEAAVALSAHEADLTQGEFASLVADHSEVGSGWNSPVTVPTLHASHHGTGHAGASRSPVRGGSGRSFSPDSIGSGRRATSPGSSTSFSIGTPPLGSVGGTSPPSLHPFTKHLQEALEKTEKKGLVKRDSVGASSIASAGGTLSASQGSLGLGGIPFPSAGGVDSLPNSPSLDQLNDVAAGHDVRRLSFISMADVINDERMAEITGSQFEQPIGLGGGGVPSRTVSGGSADLPDIFAGLNVAGPPLGGSLGTGTSTPTKHWRD